MVVVLMMVMMDDVWDVGGCCWRATRGGMIVGSC